jgi:Omp85 superfamily domain
MLKRPLEPAASGPPAAYRPRTVLGSRVSKMAATMLGTLMPQARCPRYAAFAPALISAALGALATPAGPASASDDPIPLPEPVGPQAAAAPAPHSWFDPATAPFIPVPLIGVDPDSGTTLGILPVWLQTDESHDIRRIYAPDVLYNANFGYGINGRVYAYPSADEQWSVLAFIQQHVQRSFDAEYQVGRQREQRWSINASLIYDRNGTPRFFGIGNESPAIAETNYTAQGELAQVQIGFNLSHAWQLQYTAREEVVDVLPGTLARIASTEARFGHILGVGTNAELLNRLSIIYDTRDDVNVPSRGMEWVGYGGLASRSGVLNDSLYSEAGVDGRGFWPILPETVLAAHMALRYLPSARHVPFWALSGIGGDGSEIGGEQPLRGFGAGRFYDRDSFATSIELRRTVLSFNAVSTHVDIELTPFVDLGRVFSRSSTFPLEQLHAVYGLGFRGIARPFVVGYVDIGYGSEGIAAFTGINYPF